jgi:uncharacterized protein YegP (UPF0339 family)
MIVEIRHNNFTPSGMNWYFNLKGKNGKIIAISISYRTKTCLMRCVTKLTNTISWKVREKK